MIKALLKGAKERVTGTDDDFDGNEYSYDYLSFRYSIDDDLRLFIDPTTIFTPFWQKYDEGWYYIASTGEVIADWKKVDGNWYYFNEAGVMQTGKQKIEGKWYSFTESGVMETGWKEVDGTWYYLKADGSMATGEYCHGYRFDTNGAWTYKARASWSQTAAGYWQYGDSEGWYAKSQTIIIDGKSYTFNALGYLK